MDTQLVSQNWLGWKKTQTSGIRSTLGRKVTEDSVCFLDKYLLQKITVRCQRLNINKVSNVSLKTRFMLY